MTRRASIPVSGEGRRREPARPQARSALISGQPDYAFHERWRILAHALVAACTVAHAILIALVYHGSNPGSGRAMAGPPGGAHSHNGPITAWLTVSSAAVAGANGLTLHFAALAASAGVLLCGYVLARRLFSPLTGLLVVAILSAAHITDLVPAASVPGVISVFWWSIGTVWLERALFAERRRERDRAWVYVSAAICLGVLFSWTTLLLAPCAMLFLSTSKSHRAWLRRPRFYLAALVIPGICAAAFHRAPAGGPVPITDALSQAATPTAVKALAALGRLATLQAQLVGPVLLVGALAAAARGLAIGGLTAGGQRAQFLVCMGLPILAAGCVMSVVTPGAPMWPECGWLTLCILWAGWLTVWAGRSSGSAICAYSCACLAAVAGLTAPALAH